MGVEEGLGVREAAILPLVLYTVWQVCGCHGGLVETLALCDGWLGLFKYH